jgi:AI-2 transport protein TqsA
VAGLTETDSDRNEANTVADRRFFNWAVGLILVFVLGIVVKETRSVLFPFILAVFISYVIDPVVAFFLKVGIPKGAAIALILLGAFVVLYLLGALVYASGKTLAAELPRFEERLTNLAAWLEKEAAGLPLRLRLASYLEKVNLQSLASVVLGSLGPFIGLVSKLLVLFVFLAFIVAGRGRGTAKLVKALSPARSAQVLKVIENINGQVRRYLLIKALTSLLNGLEVWAVLAVFGVDFALLFGFLAFLLNFIPDIGSPIATVLRVGFALFQFGTIWVPLGVLLITVAMDIVIGNWVEPRVLGHRLGLSPLVVLFSLVFWGWLWGVPGMIMAVPLTAVIKIVCQNIEALRPAAVLMGP